MANKRECTVGGKLGLVIQSYTHTMDVFMYKNRVVMYGVKKTYVKLKPMEKPHFDSAQTKMKL
jgi:hypothetical protein